jgi:hypothetical protein
MEKAADTKPLRYAHPFFTPTPPEERPMSLVAGATRMADWVAQLAGPIQAVGSIRFHAVGDTGGNGGSTQAEDDLAKQMAADFTVGEDAHNPAFFFHLGDVVYGANKDYAGYLDEFYRPYMKYPGKIIAIPGNHDGEKLKGTDPVPLRAFLANFCSATPARSPVAEAGGIYRQMPAQPGVYFMLRAPFIDIIGLYTNSSEGPGDLHGSDSDDSQIQWLTSTLAHLANERRSGTRKALIFATHHPPYSLGGHSPSVQMRQTIDEACDTAEVYPDAVLSGHAHNYQRHTRMQGNRQTPYVVAGGGGHAMQPVDTASGQRTDDHIYEKSWEGYGYLLATASANELRIDFHPKADGSQHADTVTVAIG